MIIEPTTFDGLLLIRPRLFPDSRGYFFESYRREYEQQGLEPMVQVNVSRSQRGVLRGLHYQREPMQAKLVSVIRGAVFDVAVDLRQGSPTFGRWHGEQLDDENHLQIYVPKGFAHGFCVLSEEVDLMYQCSDYYHPASEVGIRWNDPQLGVDWPIQSPIVSSKDALNSLLSDLPSRMLPAIRMSASA